MFSNLPRRLPLPKLPASVHEIHRLTGGAQQFKTRTQLQKVQSQISDWIVTAAEERWGDELFVRPEEEIYKMCWDNALERWPGIDSLAHALIQEERAFYRKASPLA